MGSASWKQLAATAETGDYEPIPPGVYDFVVKTAECKETQTGKDMFKISAAVENGPHAGRIVWDNLVVSPENPKAMGMFFMKFAKMGLTASNLFDHEPTNEQICSRLIGARFRGEVVIDTYQGREGNKIKNYKDASVPDGPGVPPPPATVGPVPPAPPAVPAAPAAPLPPF